MPGQDTKNDFTPNGPADAGESDEFVDRRATDIASIITVGEEVSKKIETLASEHRSAIRSLLWGLGMIAFGVFMLWATEVRLRELKEAKAKQEVASPDYNAFAELKPTDDKGVGVKDDRSSRENSEGWSILIFAVTVIVGAGLVFVNFTTIRTLRWQLRTEQEILREIIMAASDLLDHLQLKEGVAVRVLSFRMRLRRLAMTKDSAMRLV